MSFIYDPELIAEHQYTLHGNTWKGIVKKNILGITLARGGSKRYKKQKYCKNHW